MNSVNFVLQLLVTAVPIIFILGALGIKLKDHAWQFSLVTVWLALGLSTVACLTFVAMHLNAFGFTNQAISLVNQLIRIDTVSMVMLLLITIVALVIIKFSKNYLAHEPKENDFQFWFMITLASVSVVITSNHFLIFLFAWIMISMGLHHLLMFYPERPRAALAAHKKFLISRIADLCMIAGIALLYYSHHTFYISDILQHYQPGSNEANLISHLAAILFALAALLKCAQLPLHGWLMQVMEAPTPVSALLHAGIINMGGFLMIMLSPLMIQSPIAQWLLLVVGGITAVSASLIMMTRISIKVMLAWSTCAQMGFMLVECGLGLYELALLHLIAHSFYKAYTFLNSGDVVQQYLQENLAKSKVRTSPTLTQWIAGAVLGSLLVIGLFLITHTFANNQNGFIVIATIVSISLCLLLSENLFNSFRLVNISVMAFVVLLLYIVWHLLFSMLIPNSDNLFQLNNLMTIWVIVIFITLFFGYIVLRYHPYSKFGKWLYLNLYAGLYLDEWVTRVTFKLWPAELPSRQ